MKAAALILLALVSCPIASAGQPLRDPHHPPVVLLDCYYNNEWKHDPAGHRWRFHYVWSDTLDSGYSQLADIIEALHGVPDTLCGPPSPATLSASDIYLIVDPDTPKETDHPAYIQDSSAAILAQWVAGGGTLLLFGNDSGNAEFTHWNRLASRFGITFLENSRNKVIGTGYAGGTFSHFPGHPLFHNVRKIYLKEISTLSVRPPARVLLRDGDDIIIATASYGKGLVFAVGDPWFYNEYMDHRRLPEGYDNARAARNLFRWLFSRQGGE
jgi:unsaturated rhamnogalacturonyl hydrolase